MSTSVPEFNAVPPCTSSLSKRPSRPGSSATKLSTLASRRSQLVYSNEQCPRKNERSCFLLRGQRLSNPCRLRCSVAAGIANNSAIHCYSCLTSAVLRPKGSASSQAMTPSSTSGRAVNPLSCKVKASTHCASVTPRRCWTCCLLRCAAPTSYDQSLRLDKDATCSWPWLTCCNRSQASSR